MHKPWARPLMITLLAATGLLAACDQERVAKLEEGVATETDVRKQFGEPAQIVEHADGSKLLEYPRQPEGWTNYAIEIGADGKMSSLRQLLTPANFAKVEPGMQQMAVRKLLGIPAKKITYPPKPDEEVWTWHFQQGQDKKDFDVVFNKQGQVQSTAISDDQRQQNRN
jgi:outer membrane protein assembly factor BamE (lipoprotein component of BamABCDE complex)